MGLAGKAGKAVAGAAGRAVVKGAKGAFGSKVQATTTDSDHRCQVKHGGKRCGKRTTGGRDICNSPKCHQAFARGL